MLSKGKYAREILDADDTIRSEQRVRFIYGDGTIDKGLITLTDRYVVWEGRLNAWRMALDDIPAVSALPMGRRTLVRTEHRDEARFNMQWLVGGILERPSALGPFMQVGYVADGERRVRRARRAGRPGGQ